MATLEIFPNLAVYQMITDSTVVDVPASISGVTAILIGRSDQVESLPVDQIRSSPFSSGDSVRIDNIYGQLISFDQVNKYADILVNDKVIRIFEPKISESTGGYSKRYRISHEGKAQVNGFIDGLSWRPTYLLILSDDIDRIEKIMLNAQISNDDLPFSVDQITFHTRPVIRERQIVSGALALRSMQSNAEASEVNVPNNIIDTVYTWDQKTVISKEMTFPLSSIGNETSARLYFLTLSGTSSPQYGYVLEISDYIPNGELHVYGSDLNFLGFSTLKVTGNRAFLRLGIEDKLLAMTVVEDSTTDGSAYQTEPNKTVTQHTKFMVKVRSNFKSPVTLVLDLEYAGEILQSAPPINETLPGKVLWYTLINPGDNEIRGEITIRL